VDTVNIFINASDRFGIASRSEDDGHHVFASVAKLSSLRQLELYGRNAIYPEKRVKPILKVNYLLLVIVFSGYYLNYSSAKFEIWIIFII